MGAQAVSETKANSTSIDSLKAAIPKHCFQKSTSTSMSYIVRDIALVCTVFYMGSQIQYAPTFALRCALWALYSVFQGFVFVGIWILAHECGHQAMFDNGNANDTFGLIMHSFLGVPYFSWVRKSLYDSMSSGSWWSSIKIPHLVL
jgi:fatty acid desaturase